MVQVRGDAAQITDPVAVGVGEAPGVDLVDDRALEPAHAARGYGSQRKRRTATNRPTAVQISERGRSSPWNSLPLAPGTKQLPNALTMCESGKKCETLTSQSGAPSSGNQMPEMNEIGRKVELRDRHRLVGALDQRGDRDAERGQAGGAEQQRDDRGGQRARRRRRRRTRGRRPTNSSRIAAMPVARGADHPRAEVDAHRQRRAPHALEQALVASRRDARGPASCSRR